MHEIRTKRLVLRPWAMEDAKPCTDLLEDFEVTRWLSDLPHPYVLEDAVTYIRDSDPANRFCIEFDGQVAGGIGTNDGLGFWLGRRFWRKGLMSEAAHAVVDTWFREGNDMLTSGYFVGNLASQAIHNRLGFVKGAIVKDYNKAQACELDLQRAWLSREDWLASHA